MLSESINCDWRSLAKRPYTLYLSEEVIKRCLILAFNSNSLIAECANEFYGIYKDNVVFDELSEMCLESDPGAGSRDASVHSCNALDNPIAYERFTKFWKKAKPESCLLDIHTHMYGMISDGATYEDYWKFSCGDIETYKKTAKILAEKDVEFFGGIVYLHRNGNCGLSIVNYDLSNDELYHVDKVYVVNYETRVTRPLSNCYIGNIFNF
jgi:hypothetical protein